MKRGKKSRSAAAIGLALSAMLIPQKLPAQQPSFDTGMLPSNRIMLPEGEVSTSIFLVSDADGWNDDDEAMAKTLVGKGAAVVGIDFPTYIASLRSNTDDCIYMISDIEALAQQIARAAGNGNYSLPVVAGVGEGATLALAMISQSPMATIGAAVAADPHSGIPLEKQLCTPALKQKTGDRIIYGMQDMPLPAQVKVLFSPAALQEGRDHVKALQEAHPEITAKDVIASAADALAEALGDRVDAAGDSDQPLGLPLTVLEAKPQLDTMAVIYSGDGGWRDLDAQIGGFMQAEGIPVIGVDSLRYFWAERKPQETADDLSRIIDTWRKQWNVRNVLLVGYSFGADVLPKTWSLLPERNRASVRQISLLGLSETVDYEISVTGWLGVAGEGAGGKTLDDIAKIDPALIQCVSGTDEEDDPCMQLKKKGLEAIVIDGGHHFDGDYEALTKRIVDSLKTRLAKK